MNDSNFEENIRKLKNLDKASGIFIGDRAEGGVFLNTAVTDPNEKHISAAFIGTLGAGKGMSSNTNTQREILQKALETKTRLIIDPKGEII